MQKLSDKQIRNTFREKFSDFEMEVPHESTQVIFAAIKASKPLLSLKNASILSIILVAGLVYFFRNDQTGSNRIASPMQTNATASLHPQAIEPMASIQADAETTTDIHFDDHLKESFPIANNSYKISDSRKLLSNRDRSQMQRTGKISVKTLDDKKTIFYPPDDVAGSEENKETISIPALPLAVDSLQFKQAEPRKESKMKSHGIHFSFNVMPFLSYNHITPFRNDPVQLSNFQTPGSFNGQRFGSRFGVNAEYSLSSTKIISTGLSYFQYNTVYTYRADETINNVNQFNKVDETTRGVSLDLGVNQYLSDSRSGRYYVAGVACMQYRIGNNSLNAKHVQWMLHGGLGHEFEMKTGRAVRIEPGISYVITKTTYGGLQSQSYWIGVNFAYCLRK
jgi:hypothetical protein